MLAKANVNCRNYTKNYLNYVSVFIIPFTAFFSVWDGWYFFCFIYGPYYVSVFVSKTLRNVDEI